MMIKRVLLTAAVLTSAALACSAIFAADEKAADAPTTASATAPAMTIKQVMTKAFKPENSLVKTVQSGKASDDELKQFLAYAQALNGNKPKKGDEAVWKERTQAMADATQGLLDKKEGALDSLKTSTNCMTCHKAFR